MEVAGSAVPPAASRTSPHGQHLEAEASTEERRTPEAEALATTEEASHPEAGGGPGATGRTNNFLSRPTQQPLYLKMLPVLLIKKICRTF